ncbi:MAG: FGGY-family carbohydrate kinase [Bacteroidota bacterium]|nr:FGGY-family carbohydrate kinase [Bacteroidota bacterium]
MIKAEKRVAFATLDIGTSQIKLAAYCPLLSRQITLINNLPNSLIYGSGGEVQSDYKGIREKCFQLFKELGSFYKTNSIDVSYLGICGHVSSLIEWNKAKGATPNKTFPIWLDTTSYDSLDEYNAVMGNGRSKEIIGTFLPSGTNWLFTKLLHQKKQGFLAASVFLQVGDAIFYEVSGHYYTHFSSQISMVNLKKRVYASELLHHLQIDCSALPAIEYEPVPVLDAVKSLFGFPADSFVFPAMADLYTSLYGLRLNDKEGFLLANTSEQAGAFYAAPPRILNNFLSISFDNGFINYGSTNTGGNVLSWLLTKVLHQEMTKEILDDLTAKATSVSPQDTPLILPYLQGERAPLWNSKLTASILKLNSTHTDAHLFRAILEAISFARRHCFEEIGMNDLLSIKIAGGSSKNGLWNTIRASVLNKPLGVADEKELAMAGLINYMMEALGSPDSLPSINFSMVEPEPDWVDLYGRKYQEFIHYQKLLG